MFATMRRNRRSRQMKNELGQSVDHFKRAATLAAKETSSTVGPKVQAAADRVQPAAAKAKDVASSGWDSALATITPLVAAATENVKQSGKQAGKETKRQAKKSAKQNKKNAEKLQKRANAAIGRKTGKKRGSRLLGWALIGTAVGVGAAYVAKRRQADQWDEYDPAAPIASAQTPVVGADDAAFEPIEPITPTSPNGTAPDSATQQRPL